MINLLPTQEKKGLRREYWLRLSTVIFFLGTVIVAISAASLLPAFFISVAAKQTLEAQAAIHTGDPEKDTSIATLNEAKETLDALAEKREHLTLEAIFSKITVARPAGVQLTEFVVDRRQSPAILRVSGVAPRRADLAGFAKILGSEKDFTTVSFPVSDLTANEDLTFSLTITGAF